MQSLTKERKQPPVVILQQAIFYNIFILCFWLKVVRRTNQSVWFINFPSQIFFYDVNHGHRAAILKKLFLAASVLYGCGYLLLQQLLQLPKQKFDLTQKLEICNNLALRQAMTNASVTNSKHSRKKIVTSFCLQTHQVM